VTTNGLVPIRPDPSETAAEVAMWDAGELPTTQAFLLGKRMDGRPVTWRLVTGPGGRCGWVAFGVDALEGEPEAATSPALAAAPEWLVTLAHDVLGWDAAEIEAQATRLKGLLGDPNNLLVPLGLLVLLALLLRWAMRR
jgi:hypothetical protein